MENLEQLGCKESLAAALVSVVARTDHLSNSSVATCVYKKLAQSKVRKYLRGKEMAETITMWEPKSESPYVDAADSVNTLEMVAPGTHTINEEGARTCQRGACPFLTRRHSSTGHR